MLKKPILICLLLATLFSCQGKTKSADPDTAGKENDNSYHTIDVFGTVNPQEIRSVNFDFSCTVRDIFIRDGQIIRKGDTLLELDLDSIKLDINSREQRYQQCLLDLDLLRDEYEKNKSLIESKTISQKLLRESQNAFRKKKSELELLELEYKLYKGKTESSLLAGDLLVCPMERAVIAGFKFEKGNFIGQNSKIMDLINLDTLVIEANVPEEFINEVKIGAKAEIIPLADRQKIRNGTVTFIAHGARKDNGETIVPVVISLDEKDESLLPYFNIDIRILKSEKSAD
ncbi:MAG: HlyD family efflux transporter periplasmic adaptor subunit [Spirochaetales bacterium]|nr:HlyD family efflux transporter periplasmic adaptor subunit [Spirochaetales bacterium]